MPTGYGMKWPGISLVLLAFLFLPQRPLSAEKPVTIDSLKGVVENSFKKTAKATFDLTLYKDGEPKGEFQGVTAFKAPDRIAMKLFGPLGLTIIDLVGKDGFLQIFIPPKDEFYQGSFSKDSFPIFGIPENQYQYAMEETEDDYILYLLKPEEGSLSIKVKFFIGKKEMKNRKIETLKDGKSWFRIEFNRFNGDFPLEATISLASGHQMIIKNKEVILNDPPSDELFKLKDTEGREVKELRGLLDKKIN